MTRRRRGAAAAEFLAVVGVFLSLGAGTVDFGWYFVQRGAVAVAVAEGAKAGASVLEPPGTPYGTAILATTEAQTRRALNDVGLPCADGCVIQTHVDVVNGLEVLTVTAYVPWEPVIGFTPVPSHLVSSFHIAPRDQGAPAAVEAT